MTEVELRSFSGLVAKAFTHHKLLVWNYVRHCVHIIQPAWLHACVLHVQMHMILYYARYQEHIHDILSTLCTVLLKRNHNYCIVTRTGI